MLVVAAAGLLSERVCLRIPGTACLVRWHAALVRVLRDLQHISTNLFLLEVYAFRTVLILLQYIVCAK